MMKLPILLSFIISTHLTKVGSVDLCSLNEISCGKSIEKVVVSAYNSVKDQTDNTPCISSNGDNICKRYMKGDLICASNAFDLGTWLFIPGYGLCEVADRMNKRYDRRVDVFFNKNIGAALKWGIKRIDIEVYEYAEDERGEDFFDVGRRRS